GPAVTCLLLRRIKEFTTARGIRMILLLQYNGNHLTWWKKEPDHAVTVLKCAEELGLETVDMWQPLRDVVAEEGTEGLKQMHVMHAQGLAFGHMSPAGNDFIAGLLAGRLQQDDRR